MRIFTEGEAPLLAAGFPAGENAYQRLADFPPSADSPALAEFAQPSRHRNAWQMPERGWPSPYDSDGSYRHPAQGGHAASVAEATGIGNSR